MLSCRTATVIALLFHGFGALGIITNTYQDFFIGATPLNLLLMGCLLVATHPQRNAAFGWFVVVCIVTGITVEVIGVNTGLLFGQYTYGKVLGYRWQGVPLLIGVNWFIAIYCCGITIHTLLRKLIAKVGDAVGQPKKIQALSVVVDGATLAVFSIGSLSRWPSNWAFGLGAAVVPSQCSTMFVGSASAYCCSLASTFSTLAKATNSQYICY